MKLTTVVLTLNEANFLDGCLSSARPVSEEVLVIDSGSTDGTVEIARSVGARVECREWRGYPAMRNLGLGLSQDTDWVLFLDADERVPPSLAVEINRAIREASDDIDGFLISRRNVICGRVMRASGWWPDYQLRLVRPGRCCYSETGAVHEVAVCRGTTLALNQPMIHLNYRTWGEFARKQFAFARLAATAAPRPRSRSYVGAPAREFWRRYVEERGFLDGFHGLAAALLLGAAEAQRVRAGRSSRS